MLEERFIIAGELQYDSGIIHFADFEYKHDLLEIDVIKFDLISSNINELKPLPGECFKNSFELSRLTNGGYDIVFCYICSNDNLIPHAIVSLGGIYYEITPGIDAFSTKYLKYFEADLDSYISFLGMALNRRITMHEGGFYPVSLNAKGQFVVIDLQE